VAVRSPTKPSTPRLSEVARHVVIPKGIVTTGWPAVRAKAAELGIHYDPWQDGIGTLTLGKRRNGKYAATVGGIVWSIPRQVGKTFTVGSMLMVLCILFPGLKVIWTAHRTRTATSAFRSMQGMARRKRFAPHIKHIRTANGEQEIAFRNGSVIMFGAREQGFGRGFDEVDVEVFDEAQILTEKALEDMVAATNQARHPHGALLFFIGTPPRPVDPGEEFTRRRTKALSGKTKDMLYVELGADPKADIDDRKQWAKANPSYPKRTPLESMLRLRENVGSDDSWRREGLGIWDEFDRRTVMPNWPLCETSRDAGMPAALGVAMDQDRVWLSCAMASTDTVPHLGPVTSRSAGRVLRVRAADPHFGKAQFVSEVARISQVHSVPVVLDRKGSASDLEDDLIAAGALVQPVGLDDVVTADAELYDAVEAKEVCHGAYVELDAAVAAAGWRKIGQRRAFAATAGEISMLSAASLAKWGGKHGAASVYEERDMVVL
jgi:hypothetical protein